MTITGKFKVPIYDCDVKVVVTDNLLRCINNLHKKHGDDAETICPSAYFYHDGENHEDDLYYIMFRFDRLTVSCINHEKSHLVEQILIDSGIEPLDEARSYLDGFVSRKVDLFFKHRKKTLKIVKD
jgi:hypothetical protein